MYIRLFTILKEMDVCLVLPIEDGLRVWMSLDEVYKKKYRKWKQNGMEK